MNAAGVIALLSAWMVGVTVVLALWPRARDFRADVILILSAGALMGFAVTSCTFFAATLISARPVLVSGAMDALIAGALWWRTRSRWSWRQNLRAAPMSKRGRGHLVPRSWLEWVLALGLVGALVVASVIGWRAFRAEPFGGWDGWAIWNMHARFMLRAGTAWPEIAQAAQLNWTHPDYPRLVPASVARMWGWMSDECPAGSATVSVCFGVALLGVLASAVAMRRGRPAALLGALVLIGTPFFVTFAPNQHADIPLAAYLLAAVVFALLAAESGEDARDWWALAGGFAAAAAWTKNEGLLFVGAFTVCAGACTWRRNRAAAMALIAGLGVGLLPLLYFKLRIAPANDLMAESRFGQLLEPQRHATILSMLPRGLWGFGEWAWAPWIVMAAALLAWRVVRKPVRGEWLVPLVTALMFAGYYIVYAVSPHDLGWHIESSLVRLLLQLWPLAILTWCLVVPVPPISEIAVALTTRGKMPPLIFAATSVVLGAGIGLALSAQRAANELAFVRRESGHVSASLGEGWFPLEKHGRDEWAWTSGKAVLRLQSDVTPTPARTALHFQLRSVGMRNVVIRRAGDVLWRGSVSEGLVTVNVALVLEAGETKVEFETDSAGAPESSAAGGRTLAFAMYNLSLE
jgi:hypothetical protein